MSTRSPLNGTPSRSSRRRCETLGERAVGANDPVPRNRRVVARVQRGAGGPRCAGRDVAVGPDEADRGGPDPIEDLGVTLRRASLGGSGYGPRAGKVGAAVFPANRGRREPHGQTSPPHSRRSCRCRRPASWPALPWPASSCSSRRRRRRAGAASLGQLNSQLGAQQARQQSLGSSLSRLSSLIGSLNSQISLVESREAAVRAELAHDQVGARCGSHGARTRAGAAQAAARSPRLGAGAALPPTGLKL